MTELAFSETGSGAPIVILHGLFGSSRNWGRIARALGARFRVLSVDLPNHGESPWSDAVTYPSMAAAVGAFLGARGLDGRATVLGHSMGGKTAMTLALGRPEAAARLIVVDIAPVAYGHAKVNADIIAALQALDLDRLASRKEADAALAAHIPDAMLRAYLLANLERRGGRFVWRLNLAGLHSSLDALHGFPDFPEDLHYDRPTLFLAGARSDYIRDRDWPMIAARFPKARLETIPDAGHWVHAEAPDAVVARIAAFMDAR